MFKNNLKIKHIVNRVDDKILEDYFKVEVWSPNGENLRRSLRIQKIDAENLINLLSEKLELNK